MIQAQAAMRILFLTSSLEPGRDGVGDYVRELARECVRQRHSVGIIALHDPHLLQPMESTEWVEDEALPFLRLPATLSWAQRLEWATAFRSRFQPGWISLQFVPYGFHPRGIVFHLKKFFRILTAGAPLHLMFHELWIGGDLPAPLRHRVIGKMQSLAIKQLVALRKPQRVTTTNPAYQSVLRAVGIQAATLPLFGNIPVAPIELETFRKYPNRDAFLNGVFFGALHAEWQPDPLIPTLIRTARKSQKRLSLILVGRAGKAGTATWTKLERTYGSDVKFLDLGEQPAAVISELLQICDFGISTSPWQLIGKSGTVAAMLDHGLPVIISRDDYQAPPATEQTPPPDPLLHRYDNGLEAQLAVGLPKRPAQARLPEIARQFCQQLHKP
jgi:glycosyltransferase involved in cell wall biosynthesis